MTTSTDPIGDIDPVNVSFDPPPRGGKCQKTATSSSSRVRFDSVSIPVKPPPAARTTRKFVWVAKAISKKDMYARLAEEYWALAKTFKELAELVD